MQSLISYIPWVQIFTSVILMISILLQQSGAGISTGLGGDMATTHHTRRGFERFLFALSIVAAIILIAASLLLITLGAQQ